MGMFDFVGSLLGGVADFMSADNANDTQKAMAAENIALQKQFAKEGISWKVADAKSAGIHPLYALGANTTSFAPVSIGSAGTNLGEHFSNAGNALDRAIAAGSSNEQRLRDRLVEAQIRGQEIDNEIRLADLNSKRALTRPGQVGPGLPFGTGGQHSGNVIPEQQSVMTQDGPINIPSTEYGQVMENYWPEIPRHFFRESILYPYRGVKQRFRDWYARQFGDYYD